MNTLKFEHVEKALDTSRVRLVALKDETRTRAISLAHDLELGGQKGLNTLLEVGENAIHSVADVAARFPALEGQANKLREEANRLEKARKPKALVLAIPEYDGLGLKDILPLLDGLTLEQLQGVEAYELSHKARKTVLSTIARAIGKKN